MERTIVVTISLGMRFSLLAETRTVWRRVSRNAEQEEGGWDSQSNLEGEIRVELIS
jgi:hypothetical protein